ncbi:MAG: GTP 3',8-cyclase MoaA [Planctomycetaceae bacterium]|nr:GTP 3',8-cyclase MoaA [Planctomycetaceae bacterium]
MRDRFDRVIDYARLSITDRCNLRCVYCMPEEGVAKMDHGDVLSFDEIVRVAESLARLGVTRLKVTGGEPLVRKGAANLVRMLKNIDGIASVTLTTNGILLPSFAPALRDAGLDGVNISLDTLDPDRYRRLTRLGSVDDALRGLDAALAHFDSVKINCVPMDGVQDVAPIASLARDAAVHVRFIELMPMGEGAAFAPVNRESVTAALEASFGPLTPCPPPRGNGPARYFSLPGFTGRIGFINTADHTICGSCNRVRLTADGVLKTCLHMDRGVPLRAIVRGRDGAGLDEAVADAIQHKPAHHQFALGNVAGAEVRRMSEIGG